MPAAENEDVRLNYQLTGVENGPVLVLSHSLGSNLRMWDKALPFLEQDYRVLRYDMRGHGQSSVPPAPYTIEQLGGDVLFLLERLGTERAHVCGISLGGLVAMWIGILAPHRVGRIILANTAPRIGTREGWDQRIELVENAGMSAVAQATPERWFTLRYREQHAEEMEQVRSMVAATSQIGYAGCCAALRDTDLRSLIRSIEAQCLVIAGTRDLATTAADGRALHAGLSNARYVELEASHLSAWERAGDFASAAHAFLAEGETPNNGLADGL